jgi:hypothetical protein
MWKVICTFGILQECSSKFSRKILLEREHILMIMYQMDEGGEGEKERE